MVTLQEYINRRVNPLVERIQTAHERCQGMYHHCNASDINDNIIQPYNQLEEFFKIMKKRGIWPDNQLEQEAELIYLIYTEAISGIFKSKVKN